MKLPVINNAPIEVEDFSFQSLVDFVQPIYFDNNATTRVDEDAVMAMILAAERDYGNPSTFHVYGQASRKLVEEARAEIAKFIGCKSQEVVFTSGGTESINMAINSAIKCSPYKNIISCKTEHGATLNTLLELEKNGYNVHFLSVDSNGQFDIEEFREVFRQKFNHEVALTSLMAANNETGTIHSIDNLNEAFMTTFYHLGFSHLDAVQVAGKLNLSQYAQNSYLDFLSISGHKFHAPKGIGALMIKEGRKFTPLIFGGSHEEGRRAGTENVPGILAMAAVAKKFEPMKDDNRQLFIKLLLEKIPEARINGGGIPNTVNVSFPYIHRESMVYLLSKLGVYCSVGSACAKGLEPSHVLRAMGTECQFIHGAIRFSFSKFTTEDEIKRSADIIQSAYVKLKDISI